MDDDTKNGLLVLSALVCLLLFTWFIFFLGATKGVEGRTLVENEAIDRGYAHIVLRDGQRKFVWVDKGEKP